MDYSKHNDVINALRDSQTADEDERAKARECIHFVNKPDGQWEPDVINRLRGKPRYTDDRTNPIVNQIAGEIADAEFTLRAKPAGGDATKQDAQLFDGIIRNIRNISNADLTFNSAARMVTESGLAGWEIGQDYSDGDTFDQDLLIKPINDYAYRVWWDSSSFERTHEDAEFCFKLVYVSKEEYEKRWPDKSPQSIGQSQHDQAYYYKPDVIVIAEFFRRKPIKKTLYKMSNGAVYEDSDEFQMLLDELELAGITIEDERESQDHVVTMRYMDGAQWLDDEEDTVFSVIPIIPAYANFKVVEGKIIYRGAVEKLMDNQRVHNYAFSRNVEEIALKPRNKIFMTETQMEGHEAAISTLNTNMAPVQTYNVDPEAPPPFFMDTSNVNNAVAQLIEQTDVGMNRNAGLFASNMGENPGLQSGVAIEKQIQRGSIGVQPYFEAIDYAIVKTGKILINTIPKVYDATREVRILNEDGSFDLKTINQVVIDNQTGQPISLNDLSKGNYDVTVDIGSKYKNKQAETSEHFAQLAARDPSIMGLAMDVYFRNINSPGFDEIAERARAQMLLNGTIPLEQMTDEERANYEQEQAQAQQQPQTDPAAMAMAEAEMIKGQADMLNAQNKQAEIQIKAQQLQLEAAKIDLQRQSNVENTQSQTALNLAKIEQEQQKIDLSAQRQQADTMMQMQKQIVDTQKAQAEILNLLKQATGADAIMSPTVVRAYEETAQELTDEPKREV